MSIYMYYQDLWGTRRTRKEESLTRCGERYVGLLGRVVRNIPNQLQRALGGEERPKICL